MGEAQHRVDRVLLGQEVRRTQGLTGPRAPAEGAGAGWGRTGLPGPAPGPDPPVCLSTSGCPCSPPTRSPDGST